jgi:hypothetical protein
MEAVCFSETSALYRRIWLLTLREEHGLRVFENRVMRRIFGPKRDEVTVKVEEEEEEEEGFSEITFTLYRFIYHQV